MQPQGSLKTFIKTFCCLLLCGAEIHPQTSKNDNYNFHPHPHPPFPKENEGPSNQFPKWPVLVLDNMILIVKV